MHIFANPVTYAKYLTLIITEILSVAYFPNFSITWYRAGKCHILSGRNKNQKLVGRFLKIGYFIGYYTAVPLKMYGKFGQSN